MKDEDNFLRVEVTFDEKLERSSKQKEDNFNSKIKYVSKNLGRLPTINPVFVSVLLLKDEITELKRENAKLKEELKKLKEDKGNE